MALLGLLFGNLFLIGTVLVVFTIGGILVQRLILSPIANVPGPKLAAATGLVEIYYDVVKGGQYVFKIEEWHQRYGPIIRITPRQIHIRDPDFFDEMHSNRHPRHNKLEYHRHRFNAPESMSDTPDADEHDRRRAFISPLFSRPKIIEFAPWIQSQADKLCENIRKNGANGNVVALNAGFGAYTSDIVIWFTTAMSYDFLGAPGFKSLFTTAVETFIYSMHFATHFPILTKVTTSIPPEWLGMLNPQVGAMFWFFKEVKDQVRRVVDDENQGYKHVSHRTVFHELSEKMGTDEAASKAMQDDGITVTLAGIDTTRSALGVATFWTLEKPEIRQRLQKELIDAIPDPNVMPSLLELESLPYLSAIVQETLRISYGVSGRITRYNPHAALQYGSYVIPPGYEFSMTPAIQHRNTQVFPNPHTFNPDRWLNDPVSFSGRPLNTYLVQFSKGPRMCLGMYLAQAEMFIGIATIFRRLDLELFETKADAVEMGADYFAPRPKNPKYGIRVVVKE